MLIINNLIRFKTVSKNYLLNYCELRIADLVTKTIQNDKNSDIIAKIGNGNPTISLLTSRRDFVFLYLICNNVL